MRAIIGGSRAIQSMSVGWISTYAIYLCEGKTWDAIWAQQDAYHIIWTKLVDGIKHAYANICTKLIDTIQNVTQKSAPKRQRPTRPPRKFELTFWRKPTNLWSPQGAAMLTSLCCRCRRWNAPADWWWVVALVDCRGKVVALAWSPPRPRESN